MNATETLRTDVQTADELETGDSVYVHSNGSNEIEGEVRSIDGDTVTLTVCGTRTRTIEFVEPGAVKPNGTCFTFEIAVDREISRLSDEELIEEESDLARIQEHEYTAGYDEAARRVARKRNALFYEAKRRGIEGEL